MAENITPSTDVISVKHTLSPAQIQVNIQRLDDRLKELSAFQSTNLVKGRSPELIALQSAIAETLSRCFGDGSAAYLRYSRAANIQVIKRISAYSTDFDFRTPTLRNVAESIALLNEAKRALQEDLVDLQHSITEHSRVDVPQPPASNRVFVVHGHDESALQGLARFLEKLGLEAIILREQVDQGRTIIEKFEACASGVGFAVVLLTPDDVGSAVKATEPNARARQNVIFELGYFSGKLGRGKVCLLRKGSVEIPSDLFGVIYTDMDPAEGWQTRLVKELKAAGLQFDANRLWN
jgi:predicted nucleotide-binding protein